MSLARGELTAFGRPASCTRTTHEDKEQEHDGRKWLTPK